MGWNISVSTGHDSTQDLTILPAASSGQTPAKAVSSLLYLACRLSLFWLVGYVLCPGSYVHPIHLRYIQSSPECTMDYASLVCHLLYTVVYATVITVKMDPPSLPHRSFSAPTIPQFLLFFSAHQPFLPLLLHSTLSPSHMGKHLQQQLPLQPIWKKPIFGCKGPVHLIVHFLGHLGRPVVEVGSTVHCAIDYYHVRTSYTHKTLGPHNKAASAS